jgi:hypothetical protein
MRWICTENFGRIARTRASAQDFFFARVFSAPRADAIGKQRNMYFISRACVACDCSRAADNFVIGMGGDH